MNQPTNQPAAKEEAVQKVVGREEESVVAEAPVAEAPVAEAPVAEAPVAEAPVAEAEAEAEATSRAARLAAGCRLAAA